MSKFLETCKTLWELSIKRGQDGRKVGVEEKKRRQHFADDLSQVCCLLFCVCTGSLCHIFFSQFFM